MVVRAYSGLMSRVRMIYDAYLTVKKYEKNPKLTILWDSESGCNIHYFDVFKEEQFTDIVLEVVEVDKEGYWEWKSIHKCILQGKFLDAFAEIKHRIYLKEMYKLYSKGCEVIKYNDCPDTTWSSDFSIYNKWKENKWKQIEQLCKEQKAIFVYCYESFIVPRDTSGISEIIKFKDEYILAADNIIGTTDMVGIHIRRTDHELCKKISTVGMFVKKMDNEIAENNSIKFFLSTDDKEVETELIRQYGAERIIVQSDKKWGRTSKEEMVSGIIDCLCLSKCKKIYGSFSSQFSGFAAEYGKIPIEIIK